MDKIQAGQNIKEVFENPFDEKQFRYFIRNLFNEIEELAEPPIAGSYIPDAFKDHVKQYKRIAKYTDPEGGKLDIVTVSLKKDHSIERARTMQRNFLADYLKRRGEKDAALVAYYTDGVEDWRFSFVRMDYREEKKSDGKIKIKTDLTPARRYSFLVGKNEPSHTAQQQLVPLLQDTENNPTLARIEQAFNIESVTKEFYQKYKELYLNLKDNCIEKELKRSKQFREELNSKGIDEVSFTKKLLGQIVFLYFIQKKGWLGVPKDKTWGNGDRRYLRTLLNKAIASKQNFYADYLEYLFYQALATEHRGGSDPSYYKKLDCKIPFLNGGLFEADYDWEKTDITIPNNFFTNKNKMKEGDEGDGILDVFDRYNFTVKEDEPLEKEVAVDPEMLGKVFENLLEVKDRKSKGTYYTPREIVHYMSQESLINYLDVTLNPEPCSEALLRSAASEKSSFPSGAWEQEGKVVKVPKSDIEELIRHGITALENDVRVESKGKETDTYFYQIPQSIRTHAQELDKALETIRICDPAIGSGAFPVGMMNEIVKARQVLDTYLKCERTVYDFKRHCIQECIYGVDIDHSAIDIAKLRLWLSLVVDEEDFYRIKPLPNLDYKIVEGNSLIGLPETVLRDPKIETEIEKLKIKFFEETDNDEKKKLRKQINEKIRKLLDSAEEFTGYHVDFDFKLFFSEVFHEKKGFDVVIGNPPYVTIALGKGQKHFTQDEIFYYKVNYKDVFEYKGNTFSLFIKQAITLIRNLGNLSFIIPNTLLLAEMFEKLRKFILTNAEISILINFKKSVFDTAETGGNLICLLKKNTQVKETEVMTKEIDDSEVNFGNLNYVVISQSVFRRNDLSQFRINTTNSTLVSKIINSSIQLGKLASFYNGIKTGNNKKFILDKPLTKKYKPVLRGRDINKYQIRFGDKFVLFDINLLWSNTDEKKFTKRPKIIVRQTGDSLIATVDYDGYLTMDTTHLIFDAKVDILFILGVLNSRLMNWYYQKMTSETDRTFAEVKIIHLKKLPFKVSPEKLVVNIGRLVDKILEVKKSDPSADTTALEREIDVMVYKLYGLTYEEVKTVDSAFALTQQEYEGYSV